MNDIHMVTIEIETGNSFFCPSEEDASPAEFNRACGEGLAHMLRELADKVEGGVSDDVSMRDGNGNTVGKMTITQ